MLSKICNKDNQHFTKLLELNVTKSKQNQENKVQVTEK